MKKIKILLVSVIVVSLLNACSNKTDFGFDIGFSCYVVDGDTIYVEQDINSVKVSPASF